MAAGRIGRIHEDKVHASELGTCREPGVNLQKRQARVTVKYNRKELQRRLDVEKWIDDCLDQLYMGKEDDMPDEVNLDDLLDLPSDEERVKKLQELLQTCSNDTEAFIAELVGRLEGLPQEEELASESIEHPHPQPPLHSHAPHRHEPYHFDSPARPATNPT